MSDDKAKAAVAAKARASVHEAIGKLIGDDAERDRGETAKRAGAAAGDDDEQGKKQQP